MSNDTIVNERVYNRNQFFRLIGNHKLGKSCYITAEVARYVSNTNASTVKTHSLSRKYLKYVGFPMFEASFVNLISSLKGQTCLIPKSYPFIVEVQILS